MDFIHISMGIFCVFGKHHKILMWQYPLGTHLFLYQSFVRFLSKIMLCGKISWNYFLFYFGVNQIKPKYNFKMIFVKFNDKLEWLSKIICYCKWTKFIEQILKIVIVLMFILKKKKSFRNKNKIKFWRSTPYHRKKVLSCSKNIQCTRSVELHRDRMSNISLFRQFPMFAHRWHCMQISSSAQ